MKKLIVISDWANDSLSCQEVKTAVEGFLSDPSSPNISFISSTPSTIHTSFLASQIIFVEQLYGRPLETVLFINTDPRLQSEQAVESAEGAEFIVLHLASGMYVCGPNAGYSYSLLKKFAEEVYVYRGLEKGSQFRSRDTFPRIIAALMDAKEDDLDLEETSSNTIPELEDFYIGHIDNFGNIKTTISSEWFTQKYKYDDEVTIQINGVSKKARYVTNFFGGALGDLVIFPGSSGEKTNPYMELSIWRHFLGKENTSGDHLFDDALPGMKVEVL